jgi:cytochrome bd ubiquinol oxidase subunit I
MDLDPLILSWLQLAFTIIFSHHLPDLHDRAAGLHRDALCHADAHRQAAISFGMGVVSGIVLFYQFGTNWSRFSATTSTA